MLTILRTDAGLVAQVLTGKTNRFDELVRRHMNTVYGIAFSYTRNHSDAEDLSQEAFLKAYRSLDTLQDSKKFGHWMCVITRNLSRTWFTNRKREAEMLEQKKAQVSQKTEAAYDDMREILEQQIQALDPIPREVLMLHYFSGHSTAEIAKVMNVSQAAVLKRLQRAREALGVKLIHELNIIPPAQNADKQHRRIIMSSITASGITWQLSGTSWASIAGSTLMSGKAIVTGLIVAGIVTASVVLNPKPQPAGTGGGSPLASVPMVANLDETDIGISPELTEENVSAEEVNVETPLVIAQASEETTEAEVSVAVESTDTAKDAIEDAESLKGVWRISFGEGKDATVFEKAGTAKILRDENQLKVNATGPLSELGLNGEINNKHVVLKLTVEAEPNSIQELGQYEGDFSDNFTVLKLSGELDYNSDGVTDQYMVMLFEKLSEDEENSEEALTLAKKKMTTLQQAILNYMRKEEKSLVKLSDLKEGYLEDLTLLDQVDSEFLRYYPITFQSLDVFKYRTEELSVAHEIEQEFLSTHDPALLLELEDALAKVWGDTFPVGVRILRLVNSKYNFTLEVRSQGEVRIIPETPEVSSDAVDTKPTAQQLAQRSSCQNNMKQLGIIFKMYENESPNEYIPGGFRQTYPEYLTDMRILVCPGFSNSDVDYQILFPASNAEHWKDLYYQIEGIQPEERIYQSAVPIIIEKEGCSGGSGRNVLFIDGHVEFILEENWNADMGPYLEYAYK